MSPQKTRGTAVRKHAEVVCDNSADAAERRK
jgi:hypothetical protein